MTASARIRAWMGLAALAFTGAVPAVQPTFAAESGCAATWHDGGGDWSTYGGDLAQTNQQPAEHLISPTTVSDLTLDWSASLDAGQSTPVVAGGCVYVVGSGTLQALDSRTGRLMWTSQVVNPAHCSDGFGGYCPAAVHVDDGRVYADSGQDGKLRGLAFDARTGRPIWKTEPVAFGYTIHQLASAKIARGMSLVFGEGPDFDPHARPGYMFVDARSGRVLLKRKAVPEALQKKGFAAGGIWATPAVDTTRGYVYAGTANPYSAKEEDVYSNSIVKIDIDRHRPTFGQVVDSYKGDRDVLTQLQYDAPTCQAVGPVVAFGPFPCAQTDSDFGGGPTLFTYKGKRYLAEPQKSGKLHVINPDTMKLRWKATIGLANYETKLDGNSGEASFDGKRLYVIGNPGVLHAFDPASGRELWSQVVADNPTNYRPAVGENGVLFVLSARESLLTAWSAADGSLLATFNLQGDTGAECSAAQSGGIALAHHQVVVNCGSYVATYGLSS